MTLETSVASSFETTCDSRSDDEQLRCGCPARRAGLIELGSPSGHGVHFARRTGDLVTAIRSWSRYHYQAVLHADPDGAWAGIADDDGSESLLGSRPSVVVTMAG